MKTATPVSEGPVGNGFLPARRPRFGGARLAGRERGYVMHSIVRRAICAAVLLPAALALSARAETLFDPSQSCAAVFSGLDAGDTEALGQWTLGYKMQASGRIAAVKRGDGVALLKAMIPLCRKDPTAPFATLIERIATSGRANGKGPSGAAVGVAETGRALLAEFLDPAADRAALTAALKPTPEDIRAVYAEPLATRLIAVSEKIFSSGAVIAPKPGQSELLFVPTTTARLKAGDPVLGRFPGGYRKVLSYFRADVPIVRFKFVEPGKTRGMAFDGLIFVNGHWVLIPKPWRALK